MENHIHFVYVYDLSFGGVWYNGSMAIVKDGSETQIEGTQGQVVKIYNGDWEALKEITEKWGLKDETSALRFALAILTLADPNGLSVNGETTHPADSLLKDKNGNKK